jgi:hypothetical protein
VLDPDLLVSLDGLLAQELLEETGRSQGWVSSFASAASFVAKWPDVSSTWLGSFVHPSQRS